MQQKLSPTMHLKFREALRKSNGASMKTEDATNKA